MRIPDPTTASSDHGPPFPGANADAVLHETFTRLTVGDISGMDPFVLTLNAVRQQLSEACWRQYIANVVSPHPIRPLIHEEPFTRRAYEKPRGYAGDAPLLDLIYRDVPLAAELSPLGARLHLWAGGQPACRSVQARRTRLAALIDAVADERPLPRILSVACGHLREVQRSRAFAAGRVGEIVALDQDAESLALVAREYDARRVTTARASVRRLLAAPMRYGTFDLAYAAGLYDYLADPLAAVLTRSLFLALRPGGVLLVANFAPQLRDIGYMEAIMDWRLIYRDEAAMEQCAELLPADEVETRTVVRDELGNVVYLTVRKRA